MYAIIRASGHQEKVSPGEVIMVNRLKQVVGDQVTFVPLVLSKDDGTTITDKADLEARAKVVGTIREHVKGDKVDIYQYRSKTGYRRHTGHRQPLTVVEISEIQFDGETFHAPEPEPEPEKPEKAEKAEKADKPAKGKAKATDKAKGKKVTKAKAAAKKPAKEAAPAAEAADDAAGDEE